MRSTKLQLLVTLAAVLAAAGIFAAKGLPPQATYLSGWAWWGDVAECRRALDWGSPVDERTPSGASGMSLGWTPLHWAASNGHKDVAALLISRKADVDAKSYEGWTPLHRAIHNRHKDLVELLIAHGADVNAKGSDHAPLHDAAACADKDIAELLITRGAAIDGRSKTGETPLHVAAFDSDMTRLLVAHGADVNAVNENGEAPLHRAARLGCVEVAAILIAKGADINARDNDGKTPHAVAFDDNDDAPQFDWADRGGVAEWLRQHGARE